MPMDSSPNLGAYAGTNPNSNVLAPPPSPPAQPSNWTNIYATPEYRELSARRLAGAVRVPTVSYDDILPPEQDDPRWRPFEDLQVYLRKTFPLVHTHGSPQIINRYSLLYTLPGSQRSLKPLVLAGHLDVVPVPTPSIWQHPPFSGTIDADYVHGRGSNDDKNCVIGILSALERLLEGGWIGRRGIVLAFGADEEIGGFYGAAHIFSALLSTYRPNGIAMLVDEGGSGVDTIYGRDFAVPGVVEKGRTNFVVEVDTSGGHASTPPTHTSIGVLAKIITAIEDTPIFHPRLSATNPIYAYLTALSLYSNPAQLPSWIADGVQASTPAEFQALAEKFAAQGAHERYLLQTSKAATVLVAGDKVSSLDVRRFSNSLAEQAKVTINTRVEISSSIHEVQSTYLSLIAPIAKQYSLLVNGASPTNSLSASFSSSSPTTSTIGNITLSYGSHGSLHEPSPQAPYDAKSVAWTVLARANQAAFGPQVVTAPGLMTGGTDTRHYWNLTKNIYRWTPARAGTRYGAHDVDEKIKLVMQMDEVSTDEGF
ncbi:hypothetical protein BDQ12DRAFT_715813 [Crucibulum laeve]|uniref:Uncharacterized protein n=1 Tax=Crucibulum laeve TaxID=68775 RepID=A0A5C3LNG9_9AGAR|nr:hypothetical protein BDQ12DRAFT_715813 [Crucibulum laeve]